MKQMRLDFSGRRYPEAPGFQPRDTSCAAAKSISGEVDRVRARCLECFAGAALTADEVAESLGESVLYIRPRITELYTAGKIRDTGERRKNKSGKSARVWTVNN